MFFLGVIEKKKPQSPWTLRFLALKSDVLCAGGEVFFQGGDVGVEGFAACGSHPAGGAGHLALESFLHSDVSCGGQFVDLHAEVACCGAGLLA